MMALVLAGGLSAAAAPALVWRETAITTEMTHPSVTVAEGVFHFTNTGTKAVTIENVRSGCSCTVAAPDKTVYQPGEEGTISAKLTVRPGTGLVQKPIFVTTDDPEAAAVQLTLACKVRAFLNVEDTWLAWRLGEPMTPRTVRATVDHDQPIHITEVRVSGSGFRHELKTIRNGWEYELTVTPADATARRQARFLLVTDLGPGEPFSVDVRANLLNKLTLPNMRADFASRLTQWFVGSPWGTVAVLVLVGAALLGVALALVRWAGAAVTHPMSPVEPAEKKPEG